MKVTGAITFDTSFRRHNSRCASFFSSLVDETDKDRHKPVLLVDGLMMDGLGRSID